MRLRATNCVCVLGLAAIALTAGCQKAPDAPATGSVAVIDLDAVARQLGRDTQMAESIKERESSLNEQLQVVQASYQKQITDKKDRLGTEPTDQQTLELTQLQRQAGMNLNQVLVQARESLGQHRVQLIARFREEVKPVAREVAAEKGLSVVVTKNDTVVFAYPSEVDITDAVAAKMLSRQPAAALRPVPPASAQVADEASDDQP